MKPPTTVADAGRRLRCQWNLTMLINSPIARDSSDTQQGRVPACCSELGEGGAFGYLQKRRQPFTLSYTKLSTSTQKKRTRPGRLPSTLPRSTSPVTAPHAQ